MENKHMFDIIYNPNSAKGNGEKAFKQIAAELDKRGISYVAHPTTYASHAIDLARELSLIPGTKLLVMGGDGTFSEVLNGIENFENVTIGFIPCGTGNDFARALKIPQKPLEALKKILDGKEQYTDYIQLDNKRCINCCGAGLDVDTLNRYATMKAFKGKMKYYAALFDVLLHYKFHRLRLTVDGKTIEKNVFIICMANGQYIGGGMPIAPHSDPFDGKLDVVVINEMKKRKILGVLLKFLRGKHIGLPCTETYRADSAKIEILDQGMIQIDGEVFDARALNGKIVSGKLKIFA